MMGHRTTGRDGTAAAGIDLPSIRVAEVMRALPAVALLEVHDIALGKEE